MVELIRVCGNFKIGVLTAFRAIGELWKYPSLWVYAIIPWFISLACFVALGALTLIYVIPWLGTFVQSVPDSAVWQNVIMGVLRWTIYVVIMISALAIFIFTYTIISVTIAFPFIDLLSIKYEEKAYGIKFIPNSAREVLHYFFISSFNALRINLKGLLWTVLMIPVWIWVPGGIFLCAPLLGYYIGAGSVLCVSEHRRKPYAEFQRQLKGSRAAVSGMGTVVYLGMFIPLAAGLLLPVMAISGVIIYNEIVTPKNQISN
ncbi:MAG: EI24 domain-containing protein [Victivallaceae bacterium]|nr:EI24 domain-containing protein [Victivallaceae bacterium]